MSALIDRGVDGLITDYPDRLRTVMAAQDLRLPRPLASPFDVEGHRGGRRYRPENTLASFRFGLSLPVDTLELDTGVTKDGVLVVAHDRKINPAHCCTGGFARPAIHDLTLAQIKTLDCGSQGEFQGQPGWVASPGEKMPTLQEVFDLVKASGNDARADEHRDEAQPVAPGDTVDPETFHAQARRAIEAQPHGAPGDDPVLRLAHDHPRQAARPADRDRRARVAVRRRRLRQPRRRVLAGGRGGRPDGEEPVDRRAGLVAVPRPRRAGRAAHADVVSSNWQVHDPNQGHVDSTDDYLKEDPAIFHGPPVPGCTGRACASCPTRSTTRRTCSA